ncbi:protein of unknown function (plasmid) [Methylocella tundrae]|uniref:Uncharacterized protein n=1 Tax=Methylocella tundrae TaxID=227605 RepID=A0A4U8Z7H1_METTU|nr:protein of unknown function [Methylocella tundrae]
MPIDAVPDITNNQVQINTIAPALSPNDIEKQVTYPIETALAGTPGLLYTRSLSRNGFSQITAVFGDDVDIYFARQQVNERMNEARAILPPAPSRAWDLSPPDLARSTCGRSVISLGATARASRMANQAGRATGATSPLRAGSSPPISSARPTCAPFRIGSFVRS